MKKIWVNRKRMMDLGNGISFNFIESDVLHHVSQNELIWIHGNCQTGKIDMFSSVLSTSCQVVFAPLVSDLVDQIEESNSSLEKVTF